MYVFCHIQCLRKLIQRVSTDVRLSQSPFQHFTPTGLLSQTYTDQTERGSSSLPPTQSQDYTELPDISEILRPYQRDTGAGSADANGPRSGVPIYPIYLPRTSVRAYTFDGKPFFIKRRVRTSVLVSL